MERELAFLEELGKDIELWKGCVYDPKFSSNSDYSLLVKKIQEKLGTDYNGINFTRVIDLCFSDSQDTPS